MEHPLQSQGRAARRKRDQELWQNYLERGEAAFSELYDSFFDRLFVYGCNIVYDETFVKDAIQEIFLKLLQRDRSTLEIKNISSYLFVALRNYLRKELYARANKRRHQDRYLETKDLVEEPDMDIRTGASIDCSEALKREIERLPKRQREILFLRFFEGLDYKEISEIMTVNHQVVRNYAYRGMKKLRSNMEGAYPLFRSWIAVLFLLFINVG